MCADLKVTLRRIITLAALCMTWPCMAASGQRSRAAADQPASFSLSIRAAQSTFKLDQDVIVVVTITNTSAHNEFVGADLEGSIPPFALELHDAAGNPVPRIERKFSVPLGGSFLSIPLKPGQAIDRSWNLKKTFVITAPGNYTAQAWREDYAPGAHQVRGVVKSNTITIKILE